MGTWWRQILDALGQDFSDLPDAGHATRIVSRMLVAAALGGLLGYERKRAGKAAGLRTHMLVALGAALFVLIPQQSGASPADMTRVLQGVITGIGFLGAGAIIKRGEEGHVEGLTTAAGIWLTAAIGVAAGMGRAASAIVSAILAMLILTAPLGIAHLLGADSSRGRPIGRTGSPGGEHQAGDESRPGPDKTG